MQISISLDNKVLHKIDDWAKREKRSRSNVIRKLLTDLVEEKTSTKPPVLHVQADPLFSIHQKAVDTGITDLAAQHDHYLYGTSKRR